MGVLGIGTNRKFPHMAKVNRKNTPAYQCWRDMIRRCYSAEALEKGPSYLGCEVSEVFLEFQDFADWAFDQVGFCQPGYHMDKDLLLPGNRLYGPAHTVFVPKDLNIFLTSSAAKRGQYPQGVSWKTSHQQFVAQIKENGIVRHLGLFDSVEEASAAYALAKTAAGRTWGARLQAGEFVVDSRVIERMLNYTFNEK